MASAYSKPTEYSAPTPTKDVNLINQVLAAKQQRFDVNTARIEETISAVSNVDLLRDTEKEELKGRLNNLLTQISQGSKLDLTDNNTARQLRSNVMSVIDDDLIKHVGLAKQKKAFEQRIQKLKEEDPNSYNEANLQNAYYEAGFSDYMKEKEDSFSQLQYNPYYDLNENLNKPLETFGKGLGMVKDIDEYGNEILVATKKTDKFAAQKIKNFLRLRIQQDPRLRKQLEINARAGVGFNMDYAREELLSTRDSKIKKYEEELTSIESQLEEIADPVIKAQLEEEKEYLNKGISSLKNQTFETEKSVDSAVTTMYTEGLINQYTKTYAKEDVLSIDYKNRDTLISKAVKRNSSSGAPGSIGRDIDGTLVTNELQVPEDEKEELTLDGLDKQAQQAMSKAVELISTEYPDYNNKTDEQKSKFIQEKFNVIEKGQYSINAIDGMSQETYEAIKSAYQYNKRVEKVDKTIDERFTPKIEVLYEAILKSDKNKLKIQNLAQTMPTTAALVMKGKEYSKMTDEERSFINSEVALAIAEKEGGEVSNYAKRYSNNQIENLDFKKTFGDKLGSYLEVQKEEINKKRNSNLFSGFGKAVGNFIVSVKNAVDLGTTITSPFSRVKAKSRALARDASEFLEAKENIFEGLYEATSSNLGQFLLNRTEYFAGLQDKNVYDLQLDDVWGRKGYNDLFGSEFTQDLKNAVKRPQEEAVANAIENTSVVYSGKTDREEEIRSSLENIIAGKAMGRLTTQGKGNIFVPVEGGKIMVGLADNPNEFRVSYQAVRYKDRGDKSEQKDTQFKTETITKKDLAKNPELQGLFGIVNKKITDYQFSAKNPEEFEESINYTIPSTSQDAEDLEESFMRRHRNSLTDEDLMLIKSGQLFPTVKRIYNIAQQTIKDTEQLKQYYNNELNQHYKVKFQRIAGRFIPTLYKKPKGDPNAKYQREDLNIQMNPLTQNFDIYTYNLLTSKIIQQHLSNQMKNYK